VRSGHFTAHPTNLQSESQTKRPEKTACYYKEATMIVGKTQHELKAKQGKLLKQWIEN
jgi:hypothetical protein